MYGYNLGVKKAPSGSGAVAPTISSVTISGTAVVGQTLTATASGVTGIPTPTLSYQWKRGATNIGTNSSSYTLVQADAGNTSNITCVVTATNSAGSANATSNQIAQILDATASTFITNASITDSTQRNAVNFEMVTLKAGGVTSGYIASYPLVGGSAATHKWNMFNPLDTDAAKRLVFSGTITHNANGMQGNGTNGTANTFINPSLDTTRDFTLWYYTRSSTNNAGAVDLGVASASGTNPGIFTAVRQGVNVVTGINSGLNVNSSYTSSINGVWLVKRVGNNITVKRNDVVIQTYTTADLLLQNGTIRLMSYLALPSTISAYSNKQYTDFGFLNVGTNDTQDTAIYNAVVGKETILGRSVGPQTVSDPDAQAFVTAADIQDQVQADAVNNLVIGMKAQGLWTKMKAVYPFVGGTASSHKFNLMNPADTNAAFRLTFSGSWTHDSNGITGNGTNTIALTNMNALSVLTNSNLHLSWYGRTANTTTAFSSEISVNGTYSANNWITFRTNNKTGGGNAAFSAGNDSAIAVVSNTLPGYFVGSETASNSRKLYRNGTAIATNTTNDTNTLPNFIITLGGGGGSFSANNSALASIGDGLSDSEVSTLNTLVTNFQTTLGRNV